MILMGSPKLFLNQRMDLFCGYFWIFLSKIVQTLFWVFTKIFMRFFGRYCRCEAIIQLLLQIFAMKYMKQTNDNSEPKTEAGAGFIKSSKDTELKSETFVESNDTIQQECGQIDANCCEPKAQSKEDFSDTGNLGVEEKETNKLVFKFQYQTWNYSEELKRRYSEKSFDFVDTDKASANTNKYEFILGKSFSHFLEEPEVSKFTVKELNVHCPLENDSALLSETNFISENCERRSVDEAEKFKAVASIEQHEEDEVENLNNNMFQHRHSINSKHEDSLKSNSHSSIGLDLEDSNQFDTLWEHQYLIEQLKMEMNKVRATGLPTILENYESPRIIEELKPWKIEEKFQHGSIINELPKFYRSYREGMRKFDILNYQKMYAIGSLHSKDPVQTFSSRENSSPTITSFLPYSFRLCRRKESEPDPMKKFIREFYSDLEMVYVGQLCLSWEFLKWEYDKALELWESDQYGLQRYNEVAGEFQQFQVLLQRFIENEPFQGPRVENYARNRCVMCNLLQVPVIREDNANLISNDEKKLGEEKEDKDAITSDMLIEILEESIRTIWRFIRADKDASKGPRETQVKLLDPADSELVVEIRAELQQKEKRLSEFLKSKSSILSKFQKHEEDGTDNFLYFFSQVDMKLVWRVLNMSRITRDQLAWCRNKLNKINFVNRRIIIEPSFLLFPC